MNKFIQAIKSLDMPLLERIIHTEPKWTKWAEEDGKNGLHYLCAVPIASHAEKADTSFEILKLFLKNGMDINSIHIIADGCDNFPATPLWYAYTRGRNKKIYKYLLDQGANPENCMYAIAWYDDIKAAALFKKHGANIEGNNNMDSPFFAAYNWKRYNVTKWFLENGADVDFADSKGNTALFYAVKRKLKNEQIELLLRFGADVDKKNNEGVSPKGLAEANRQKKILGMFTK
jgi:ankyrin repeat protein